MVSQHICCAFAQWPLEEKRTWRLPVSSLNPMECFAGISDLNHNPPPTYTPMWWDAVLSLALHLPPDFTYLANPFLTSSGVTKVLILLILSICWTPCLAPCSGRYAHHDLSRLSGVNYLYWSAPAWSSFENSRCCCWNMLLPSLCVGCYLDSFFFPSKEFD
jgi:hypothetical protein